MRQGRVRDPTHTAAMDLRNELLPPPVSDERLAQLRTDIERIQELIAHGAPGEAEAALAAFNSETGHTLTRDDFADACGSCDVEDLARVAARPAWPRCSDVTRDELAEIVRRIMAADPECDYYVLLLMANVTHPGVVGLIFHPPVELRDATPEQIVDAALAYRPIAL